MRRVLIADYGMGNLRSVQKALEFIGEDAFISGRGADFAEASHIIVPGVGAIADAAERLKATGLWQVLQAEIKKGKPFLGICLGMQLLFEKSFEDGEHTGMGIFKGDVTRFDIRLKVPQIGWNLLDITNKTPLFEAIDDKMFYFVHSYHVNALAEDTAAYCDYGRSFAAAVQKDNVYGVQFHPEKSGDTGLKLLKNFIGIK